MDENNNKTNNDVYDTTIYTEFSDLPKETQKSLYKEFRNTSKEENKIYLLGIIVPIVFAVVIAGFLIASVFIYIFQKMNIPFVLMLICACIVLLGFIILKAWMDRVKKEHELKYSHWLKVNKRVIATLKEKEKKK